MIGFQSRRSRRSICPESLDARQLDGVDRYEVPLDRGLERTLEMRLRLKDLRQGTIVGLIRCAKSMAVASFTAPEGLVSAMRPRGSHFICSPLRRNLPIGSRLRWPAMGKAEIV